MNLPSQWHSRDDSTIDIVVSIGISIITADICCDLALWSAAVYIVTVNEVIISIITTDACCDLALCMNVL